MYAAAGGASLASRQARQKQRQKKQKQQQNKATELIAKPPHAKQFQNYTDPSVPRLSRVERAALKPPTQLQPHERRHSTSNYHLKEHHKARIRESPSICIPVNIQTPPHHHQPPSSLVQQNHLPLQSTPSLQSQLPQIFIPEGDGKLERRCSFVRQVEEMEKCQEQGVLDRCNHICNFEIKADTKWDSTYYTSFEQDAFGSLDYPFSECSQGRAAWQERERGRRCSLSEEARQHRIKQTEAHHRWMKRNRIHDTTYGTGSDSDSELDFLSQVHQSAAANALLYVGLGTTAIGSVIFFVGTGEKGFRTFELRLIGPTLIICGLLCCLIRVLLCAIPCSCCRKRKRTRLKANSCPHRSGRYPLGQKIRDARSDFVPVDQASLLQKNSKKKVSIVPPNHSLPSTSTTEMKPDNVPEMSFKLSIPEIQLPASLSSEEGANDANEATVSRDDSIIELQALDLTYDIQSVSSNDSDSVTVIEKHSKTNVGAKLAKQREPIRDEDDDDGKGGDDVETCLSVVIEKNCGNGNGSDNVARDAGGDRQTQHSGIVLSPLQLGQ